MSSEGGLEGEGDGGNAAMEENEKELKRLKRDQEISDEKKAKKMARIDIARDRIHKAQEDQSRGVFDVVMNQSRAEAGYAKIIREMKEKMMEKCKEEKEECRDNFEKGLKKMKEEMGQKVEGIYLKKKELRDDYDEKLKEMEGDRLTEMEFIDEKCQKEMMSMLLEQI